MQVYSNMTVKQNEAIHLPGGGPRDGGARQRGLHCPCVQRWIQNGANVRTLHLLSLQGRRGLAGPGHGSGAGTTQGKGSLDITFCFSSSVLDLCQDYRQLRGRPKSRQSKQASKQATIQAGHTFIHRALLVFFNPPTHDVTNRTTLYYYTIIALCNWAPGTGLQDPGLSGRFEYERNTTPRPPPPTPLSPSNTTLPPHNPTTTTTTQYPSVIFSVGLTHLQRN